MKTVICPKCGRREEVGDKVRRKHCLDDGYLMKEVEEAG